MAVAASGIEAARVVAVIAAAVVVVAGIGARRVAGVVMFARHRIAQRMVMAMGRRIEQVRAEGGEVRVEGARVRRRRRVAS